jgi:hypothetical protein
MNHPTLNLPGLLLQNQAVPILPHLLMNGLVDFRLKYLHLHVMVATSMQKMARGARHPRSSATSLTELSEVHNEQVVGKEAA